MMNINNNDLLIEADVKLSDMLEKGHNLTTPQMRVLLTIRDYLRKIRKDLENKA